MGVQGYVSIRQQCAREGQSPAGGNVTKCLGDDSHTYTHGSTSCQCLLSHIRVKIPHKAVLFSFLQDDHVVIPQDKAVGPLAGLLLPKRYLLGRQITSLWDDHRHGSEPTTAATCLARLDIKAT